jgi:hypothetical protein
MPELRRFVLVMVLLLFCPPGGLAGQEGQDAVSGSLVVDLEGSSLLRQGFYLEDLSAVLSPVLTPEFLGWLGGHDGQAGKKLAALPAARIKEITLLFRNTNPNIQDISLWEMTLWLLMTLLKPNDIFNAQSTIYI